MNSQYIPYEDGWKLFSKSINKWSTDSCFRIHAFVLMNNHFHLLISNDKTDDQSISTSIMAKYFHLTNVDFNINISKIENWPHFKEVYKYIYRNPVEAGLCMQAEEYPFSTLSEVLGKKRKTFEVVDVFGIIQNPLQKLKWINSPSSNINLLIK